MNRKEVRAKIAEYLRNNPGVSYKATAQKLSCSPSTIANIAREFQIRRKRRPAAYDLSKLED